MFRLTRKQAFLTVAGALTIWAGTRSGVAVELPVAAIAKPSPEAAVAYDPLAILKHPDAPKELPDYIVSRMAFLKESLLVPIQLNEPFEATLTDVLSTLNDLGSPPEATRKPEKRLRISVDESSFAKQNHAKFDPNRQTIMLPKMPAAPLFLFLEHICRQFDADFRVSVDSIVIFAKAGESRTPYDPTAIFKHPDMPTEMPPRIVERMTALKKGLFSPVPRNGPIHTSLAEALETIGKLIEPKADGNKAQTKIRFHVDEVSFKAADPDFDPNRTTVLLRFDNTPLIVLIDQICKQIDGDFRVTADDITIYTKRLPKAKAKGDPIKVGAELKRPE